MKKIFKLSMVTIVAGLMTMVLSSYKAPTDCPDATPPQCPYPDPEYAVFFPHPNDCHWFFVCENGVAYCKPCPADLCWNNEIEACDFCFQVTDCN